MNYSSAVLKTPLENWKMQKIVETISVSCMRLEESCFLNATK